MVLYGHHHVPVEARTVPGRSQPARLDGRRASGEGHTGFPPLRALPGAQLILCYAWEERGGETSAPGVRRAVRTGRVKEKHQ